MSESYVILVQLPTLFKAQLRLHSGPYSDLTAAVKVYETLDSSMKPQLYKRVHEKKG